MEEDGKAVKSLTLYRVSSLFNEGTFGVLLDGNVPFCVTLERPWLDNKKGESCIPDGNYVCRRVDSPKFENTFEVTDVLNRTAILFHKGNLMEDSHGCIIVGEMFESLNRKNAVLASGKAFQEFLDRLKGEDEFELSIEWV